MIGCMKSMWNCLRQRYGTDYETHLRGTVRVSGYGRAQVSVRGAGAHGADALRSARPVQAIPIQLRQPGALVALADAGVRAER